MTTPVDLDGLLRALAEQRAMLLAALEGTSDEELTRPLPDAPAEASTLLDVLWRRGARDDWTRLVIDQALDGRPTAEWAPRSRPAYLQSAELIVAWLAQTRGALLARVRRLADTELDRSLSAQGSHASPRTLLGDALSHDADLTRRLAQRSPGDARSVQPERGRA